jgi:hypothetical protein
MNRRAIVAGILALLPLHARAQRGIENFPLAPQPNPNTTCADLFSRKAGEIQPNLLADLLVWQHNNPHVKTAYVAVNESQVTQVPIGSWAELNGTRFTLTVMAQSIMPEDALWSVMADCGNPL